MATFKELYAKMKPGPSREALIYQSAIQQGKPKMIPITIPGPNNTKITYQVMPDFLMIDGIRVTLTPTTAQRIADAFGMQIPTAKMADQIYQSSNKISARPLSGSGVTIDGRHYSGDEVTRNLISDSRTNIAYSDIVNQQIAQQKDLNPNKPVDGFNKSIVQSEAPGRTGYYGLWTGNSNEPLQGGNGVTSHDLTQTEYCAGLRLVSNDVVITRPDGTVVNTNLPKLLRTKSLSSSISFAPGKGVQRYNETKAGPPPGHRGAKIDPADKDEAEAIAKSLLGRPMWTELPITLKNGKQYIVRVEPHSNKPKGVSLYESTSGNVPSITPATTINQPEPMQVAKAPTTAPSTPQSLMKRVTDFIDTVSRSIG
jgi:hypothetical protein